jgi:hypothetical protein
MTMGEGDSRVEVLKEIRDEIRGLRGELEQLRVARISGVRTARVERNPRWRIAELAGTGALAVVALVLALGAGRRSAPVAAPSSVAPPAPVAMAPAPAATAPVSPRTTSAPVALSPAPIAQPAVAAKPAAKPAARLLASAPAAQPAKKRVKTEAPEASIYSPDDGDTIPFPPPRHVRVHKMSYGPVESEPAKL